MAFASERIYADDSARKVQAGASSNAANVVIVNTPLTNRALRIIASLRGVEPAAVKIRASSTRAGSAFEIDIAGVKDASKEAEQLSKEFGAAAAVILEQVSDDGVIRTNWTFRNGKVEQRTAPAGPSGLGPRARRMYVWPESVSRPPSAPAKLRVRDSQN